MCGIAGIFPANDKKIPSEALLRDMINKLKHRGPAIQQVLALEGLGLAHARLSIIDLHPESNQPMLDSATGNWIVFNGEIYNYLEIKEELIALGHKFDTNSDTEVILKAYSQWGISCQNKFNGMWAFVIYDKKTRKLLASRDRMGVKPLVFGIAKDRSLVFASEAKAILDAFPEFKVVNKEFLLSFVERDFFACYKDTFYGGLYNLLPGHYFVVSHGEVPEQKRYWDWTPSISPNQKSDREVIEEFSHLLKDSIKLRFRSDVPVGSCLSGGLDSGTIVGLATQLFNKPLQTFSCIFPNTPEFDESAYIKASVSKFGTNPYYVEPTHDDFIKLMYDSIYEQDGPTGGPSILSQRAVMELAGKQVRVVLDGQGADELLGGYHPYFHYSLKSQLRGLHKDFSLRKAIQYYRNSRKINKRVGSGLRGFKDLMLPVENQVKFTALNIDQTQLHYMSEFEDDDLNTLLLEHVFTNLTNLLHYEDRNSMRFSVESRLPYLDYRLVEFAFSLRHHYKIRGSTTKWLLNNVAKNVLPQKVLNRKDKMGFTTPAHKWLMENNNLKHFEKYFTDENMIFSNLPDYMRDHFTRSFQIICDQSKKIITPSTSGDINGLWRFFTANMWLEQM